MRFYRCMIMLCIFLNILATRTRPSDMLLRHKDCLFGETRRPQLGDLDRCFKFDARLPFCLTIIILKSASKIFYAVCRANRTICLPLQMHVQFSWSIVSFMLELFVYFQRHPSSKTWWCRANGMCASRPTRSPSSRKLASRSSTGATWSSTKRTALKTKNLRWYFAFSIEKYKPYVCF